MQQGPICFLLGTLALGGIGRHAMSLGEEFLRQDRSVDFFVILPKGEYVVDVSDRIQLFSGSGRTATSLPALIRYLRDRRPRILISANPHIHPLAIAATRLAGTGTKVVCAVHTTLSVDGRSKNLYGRFLIWLARYAYPAADAVVAVSEGVASDLIGHVARSPKRVEIIYNPAYSPSQLSRADEEVECEWLRDSRGPVLLGIGRLTAQKDFPTLLRAMVRVREHLPDARLIILGEGEDRQDLLELAKDLGIAECLLMPGYVPNPAAYMARASVVVLSSAWEGFGNVLVEAMAVGTPVVSTDCPSGPAEILDHGRFGKLVPVGDHRRLGDAIIETLYSPPSPAVLRERAESFSAAASAHRWLQLIDSL